MKKQCTWLGASGYNPAFGNVTTGKPVMIPDNRIEELQSKGLIEAVKKKTPKKED